MIEIQIIADSGLLVLIWLVQLIIYPSFRYTQEKDFIVWHGRYMGLISLIVSPLILLQIGVELVHIFNNDYRWIRMLMILAVLTSTFSLSVPNHKRLSRYGKDPSIISRLVRTNWLRTVLWSLLFTETAFGVYR
ncbi:MAG: hypothetical protein ACI8ZB_004694 [Desulforhopalus sp.]|jgi:hypothetical protein